MLNIHVVGRRETANRKYIGRGSIWGNRFIVGMHGSRDQVCDMYEEWFWTQKQLVARLHELRGKDLLCFCAPKRGHGHFLVRAANA